MTRYPKGGKGRHWTVAELRAVPASWAGDKLADGDGLTGDVRVARDGAVSVRWQHAYKWQGKVQWLSCGTWPAATLEQARATRDDARRQVREGVNPSTRRKADRIEAQRAAEAVLAGRARQLDADKTIGDLAAAWFAAAVNHSDGGAEMQRMLDHDVLPKLSALRVADATEKDLAACVGLCVERGAYRQAAKTFTILRSMFAWGEKRQPWRGLLIEGNPAALLDLDALLPPDVDPNAVRERVLSEGELRELRDLIAAMHREYRAAPNKRTARRPIERTTECAIWIALGTLCRIGELLLTEWSHVDLAAGTWFIPAPNVKGRRGTRRDQLVNLSPFVLRHFTLLHKTTGHGHYCFPSRDGESPVYEKAVTKQVSDRQVKFSESTKRQGRVLDNTLLLAGGANGNWTPHDLRRTGATMMQALGVMPEVIDRCQNHVLAGSRVRRSYLQHDYAPEKRDAWLRLGERIEAILAPRLVAAA